MRRHALAAAALQLLLAAAWHRSATAAEQHPEPSDSHDYCIVGGGLAGVQLAHFMEQAGRDYVVLEKGVAAGSFFRKFPRHRNLISINKRHTGRGGTALSKEHNLRHDWHSLLSGVNSGDIEEEALFANLVDDDHFYPKADKLAQYAAKWVQRYGLNVRTQTEVRSVREARSGSGFELDLALGERAAAHLDTLRAELAGMKLKALKRRARELGVDERKIEDADDADDIKAAVIELCVEAKAEEIAQSTLEQEDDTPVVMGCRWVVLASGFSKPHVPDIPGLEENSYSYNDMPAEREFYTNKTVAILGAGNAGFETFKAIMEDAAYVHIHGRSQIRMAWETHYVGDLRSVNVVPVDNYQLKSQDILHLPSPVGLTKEDTAVAVETMPDGTEAICFQNKEQEEMKGWLRDDNIPANVGDGAMEGHSLTFKERVGNLDSYCYDVVIRCTGMEVDTSIFNLSMPLATQGGRAKRKYPALNEEYESTSAPGMYVAGTLAHVRDFRKSSGGFVHGFRYTARALFKWLEQKHHDVPWPAVQVSLDRPDGAASEGSNGGLLSGLLGGGDGAAMTLTEKLTERMDTASGLYQMFNSLCDLVVLPARDKHGQITSSKSTAEYMEEIPLDLVPQFVKDKGREYIVRACANIHCQKRSDSPAFTYCDTS
jgi:thioredoxin reductase